MNNKDNNLGKFQRWWKAPNTRKDRYTAATIGAFGGVWLGGLGRIMLGELPVSIADVGLWAFGGVIVLSLLGAAFPKVVSCICFPFSTFG
jgi:hypothetical protein